MIIVVLNYSGVSLKISSFCVHICFEPLLNEKFWNRSLSSLELIASTSLVTDLKFCFFFHLRFKYLNHHGT